MNRNNTKMTIMMKKKNITRPINWSAHMMYVYNDDGNDDDSGGGKETEEGWRARNEHEISIFLSFSVFFLLSLSLILSAFSPVYHSINSDRRNESRLLKSTIRLRLHDMYLLLLILLGIVVAFLFESLMQWIHTLNLVG